MEQDQQNTNWEQQEPKRQSAMATASLVMGILGIVTACCCYGGLIFGGLGIIFAILSRTEEHLTGFATAGMVLSIIAMVIAPFLFLAVFVALGDSMDSLFQLSSVGIRFSRLMGGAF